MKKGYVDGKTAREHVVTARVLAQVKAERPLCGRPWQVNRTVLRAAIRRTRTLFSLTNQHAAPCSTPRGEHACRFVGALLAPTLLESHGAQDGVTALRSSAAGAQPRTSPPASTGGTSMASTHPLLRSSAVVQALSFAPTAFARGGSIACSTSCRRPRGAGRAGLRQPSRHLLARGAGWPRHRRLPPAHGRWRLARHL